MLSNKTFISRCPGMSPIKEITVGFEASAILWKSNRLIFQYGSPVKLPLGLIF
jgi:hypothetical protein